VEQFHVGLSSPSFNLRVVLTYPHSITSETLREMIKAHLSEYPDLFKGFEKLYAISAFCQAGGTIAEAQESSKTLLPSVCAVEAVTSKMLPPELSVSKIKQHANVHASATKHVPKKRKLSGAH
jgi:hypothetical protein